MGLKGACNLDTGTSVLEGETEQMARETMPGFIRHIGFTDLFFSELEQHQKLYRLLVATVKMGMLVSQEDNRIQTELDLRLHAFDSAWDAGMQFDEDVDYWDSRERIRARVRQGYNFRYERRFLINLILLAIYLLCSVGVWHIIVAGVRASLCSVTKPCLVLCAPSRHPGIGLGFCIMLGMGMVIMMKTHGAAIFVLPALVILGTWVGPCVKTACAAFTQIAWDTLQRNSGEWIELFAEEFFLQLAPQCDILLSPYQCRYSQNSISSVFHDGQDVFARREEDQYVITVCFHDGFLFSLNNRTLFSAVLHDMWPIRATVVEKPSTWNSRFTARFPWTSVHVRRQRDSVQGHTLTFVEQADVENDILEALVIPAAAFSQTVPRPSGHVVLEVNNIIKPRQPQVETLVGLLRERCPGFNVGEVEGERSFARARISLADEDVIRAVIKAIGRQRRRRVNITEVSGTRVFLSPRD